MSLSNKQKRVLAVHDISSVGKCSITVALPIISCADIECSILPTAILSTHTGGFKNIVCQELDKIIVPFAEHWKNEGVVFDAFYSGYLANSDQISLVKEAYQILGENRPLVFVDPVMGDNGELYKQFDASMVDQMRELCKVSDVLVPNLTEASLLLGEEYPKGDITLEIVEPMLKKLSAFGPKKVVITDVAADNSHLGAAYYDAELGVLDLVMNDRISGYYHGTGDVFASALLAGLLRDKPLATATRIAIDFTCASIRNTQKEGTPPRMGVRFEAELAWLAKMLVQ